MHLVGFTIEIYYNARPYERQIRIRVSGNKLSCRYLYFHGQLYYFLTGLDDLVVQLDRTMLKVTGRRSLVVRVRMGGEEVR